MLNKPLTTIFLAFVTFIAVPIQASSTNDGYGQYTVAAEGIEHLLKQEPIPDIYKLGALTEDLAHYTIKAGVGAFQVTAAYAANLQLQEAWTSRAAGHYLMFVLLNEVYRLTKSEEYLILAGAHLRFMYSLIDEQPIYFKMPERETDFPAGMIGFENAYLIAHRFGETDEQKQKMKAKLKQLKVDYKLASSFTLAPDGSVTFSTKYLDSGEIKIDTTHSSDGSTLLHLAVQAQSPQAVTELIKRGVACNAKNSNGDTALDLAKKNDLSKVLKTIESHCQTLKSSNTK
ncbi:ankyrin repeat domain-containing protein [Vibrio sp. SCSIO 43136]|uniref:ankyrin repeat domain-containing protein n=1 Tax=Vibrio sp. SCSIO 43136 TaxID=2819101 RepID=UPI00207548DB|nr:ankyrin repeat domain-containing protein [Vibrio sp. SCSIO 43136]USD67686.1 ankyrin repeat domain-containing protein [Vibrio sp. SCSIO 43136]